MVRLGVPWLSPYCYKLCPSICIIHPIIYPTMPLKGCQMANKAAYKSRRSKDEASKSDKSRTVYVGYCYQIWL